MAIIDWFAVKKYYYDVFLKPLTFSGKVKVAYRKARGGIIPAPDPDTLILGVTHRCQLDCAHCGVDRKISSKPELTTEEARDIIDQACKMGVYFINFTGGEPLLRRDLEELIKYASEKKVMTAVSTNGLELAREKVRSLKQAGINFINVSIDSACPEMHDRLRGYPGLFKSARKAVVSCVDEGVNVFISTYISRINLPQAGDIAPIIQLAKKLRAKGVVFIFAVPGGKLAAREDICVTEQALKLIHNVLDPVYVHLENICYCGFNCKALLKKLFYVSPYGDIQPCNFVPFPCGNIREDSMADIWKRMCSHSLYKISDTRECIMRFAARENIYRGLKEL